MHRVATTARAVANNSLSAALGQTTAQAKKNIVAQTARVEGSAAGKALDVVRRMLAAGPTSPVVGADVASPERLVAGRALLLHVAPAAIRTAVTNLQPTLMGRER